jgi:hypothetical protein
MNFYLPWLRLGLSIILLLGQSLSQGVPACRSSLSQDIKVLWEEFDLIKRTDSRYFKSQAERLMRQIEAYLYEQGVQFERNPQDKYSILIQTVGSHSLNRMAKSFFEIYRGARIEINPVKLKIQEAGALFEDSHRLLTLASDNVINLKSDSFLGHEIRHAFGSLLSEKGFDHVFMGWLKKKKKTNPLQETYPDAFSLDELAAYYYQVIVLIRESKRQPELTETVLQFAKTGSEIAHFLNPNKKVEILQFAKTYVQQGINYKVEFSDNRYSVLINLPHHELILEFNLKPDAKDILDRIQELGRRAQKMEAAFQQVIKSINSNKSLNETLTEFSRGRDLIDQRPQGAK